MMVVGKDDLGLNLTLGLSSNDLPPVTHHTNLRNHSSLQLNLMIPALTSPASAPVTVTPPAPAVSSQFPIQKKLWNSDLFPPTDLNSDPCIASNQQPYLRGIDVNRLPASTAPAPADEDDVGVSSPNSTLSSVSGKRIERDPISDDQDGERACSRSGGSDEEDGGDGSRKKLRLSKDQSAILEESFKEHNTLNPKQKLALAKRLGLRPRQVEVWFQNRRARTKLKQTEVDCEFLKRCCDQLTEENRRLQKEVAELRALKLSPQFYMQMTPPTTLTMCPSCERVAAPPSSSTAAAAPSQGPPVRNHRPVPVNPWLSSPVPVRPFEALRPRS